MAENKNMAKPADNKNMAKPAAGEFDWSSVLKKAGLAVTDMREVGGLTPIYASENAHEDNWPPLVGLLVGIQMLEFKNETDPKQRTRPFFVVECEVPTMALDGTGDEREVITRDVGDYVLMPISGALKNIKELRAAAADPSLVHRVAFRVTGERENIGRPKGQEMWPIEAFLIAKPIKRTGKYAPLEGEMHAPALEAAANGIMNTTTGQMQDKLVGSNA